VSGWQFRLLRRKLIANLRRTHLLGCIMFIGTAAYFLIRPSWEVNWEEKMIFSAFFIGAILCLGFSFTFHTVSCHSEVVGKLFSK
jgi:adiponectin receptor